MPPPIALLICTIFVLFLLRFEHNQYPEASHALWIPTIWMLLNISKPLGVWFSYGGEDMESGSPLDRAFLATICFLALVILVRRQFRWATPIKGNPWIVLLLGYSLVSILWSNIPFTSFKRWTRELVALSMVLLLASETDWQRAMQSLFRRIIYISIPFSLLLIKYYPHLGVQYGHWSGALMWTGISLQKNGLAFLCSFTIFFLSWSFVRRWLGNDTSIVRYQTQVELFILTLAIWLFTGPQHSITYSATSTVSLAVGLASFIAFLWMHKMRKLIAESTLVVIIVFVIVYGTVTPFLGKLTLFDVSSMLGRNEDLTGRSEIWAVLVPFAMQRPILGHGFGGFWTDAMRQLSSSYAHNGSLDVILSIGLVGLFLLSMVLVSCCRNAHRQMTRDYDWGILAICLLLMGVVHNIAESSLTSFSSRMMATLLFLDVSYNNSNSKRLDGGNAI